MKKKKQNSTDNKLYSVFSDFYENPEDAENAVKDAKKAFSYFRQDVLHKGGDQ